MTLRKGMITNSIVTGMALAIGVAVTARAQFGGPPPELAAAVGRSQRNGLILMALSIVMVVLMVMKPALGF